MRNGGESGHGGSLRLMTLGEKRRVVDGGCHVCVLDEGRLWKWLSRVGALGAVAWQDCRSGQFWEIFVESLEV